MSTALYRRYRPETFAEVIGQPQVTEPLRRALTAGRVGHAYLFSGPRGCGKTTSARTLARTLNCEKNTPENPIDIPCGVCASCIELATGGPGSLDVVEIDAASHGGVDDARELRDRAAFAPTRDRYKIFIIDEAHMVSQQGFNALLKIVEEPPPHVKFLFATTEPERVLPTIRSRTHHYPFRLVPPEVLGPYLDQICEQEGFTLGAGVAALVMRAGAGSVRDSISVLDQLIAGASGKEIEYDEAVALLGYTDAALLDDAVDAIAARDGAALFAVIDSVIESGHPPQRFVEDLLGRLRDLIVIAVSGDAAEAVLRDQPPGEYQRMTAQAGAMGLARLSTAADLVSKGLKEMAGATSPRLQIELIAARLLLPEAGGPVAEPSEPTPSTGSSARPAPRPNTAAGSEQSPTRRQPTTATPRHPAQSREAAVPQDRATAGDGTARDSSGAPQPSPSTGPAATATPRHPAQNREAAVSQDRVGAGDGIPRDSSGTSRPSQPPADPAQPDWLALADAATSKKEIGEIGKQAKQAGAAESVLAELRERYQQFVPKSRSRVKSQPKSAEPPRSAEPPLQAEVPYPDEPPLLDEPPLPDGPPPGNWADGFDGGWGDIDADPKAPTAAAPRTAAATPTAAETSTMAGPAVDQAEATPRPSESSAVNTTAAAPTAQSVIGKRAVAPEAPAAPKPPALADVANASTPAPPDSTVELDELDEISDDDPELEESGLTGVPLILQMLGGKIIAEEIDGEA